MRTKRAINIVDIPAADHRRFKVLCASRDVSMAGVIKEFMKEYCSNPAKNKKQVTEK